MAGKQTVTIAAVGALVLAGFAFWAGTKQGPAASAVKPTEGTAGPTKATATAPAAQTTVSSAQRGGDPFGKMDLDGLGQKLAEERAQSGKSNPSAASVFAAIEKKLALRVEDHLQVLGSSVGARYCERGSTKSDVYVVVCEFSDEAAATKGIETGSVKAIAHREVLRVKQATVAIHRVGDGKDAEEDAKRIHDVVVKL